MYQSNRVKAKIDYIVKDSFAYIPVPKCMSSQMRKILVKKKWNLSNTPQDAEYIFGLVREPIERWISGVAQTYYNHEVHKKNIRENFDWYVNRAWHDPHTSKQIWYYEDDPGTELFRIDQLDIFVEELSKNGIKITIPEYKNDIYPQEREDVKKLLKESLTDEHIGKLKEYYKEDIQLYEQSKR